MEVFMRLITCALAVALLAGCASQPSAPTPAPVPATAAAPAPVAAPAASASAKARAPAGYKAVERNGVTFFCTNVATVGTKFKKEVCMTESEYAEVERRGENVRQDMQKNAGVCGAGGGACGGG
jgi:hypothetical protein